ncbi:sensor histidine kinase [Nocardioides ginsengisoli]|uniref:histidine kinase n=1 Tax=Nocardioides ginsengisoli TaxID=363868 RepID=A0ABW3VYB6_9ACTN
MLRWLRAQIEDNLDARHILCPWWVPVVCTTGQVVSVLGALWFRDALWPLDPLALCLVLVLVSPVLAFAVDRWLPWWLDIAGALVAAVLLMLHPPDGVVDLAPALLALVTAEITARDGLRQGAIVGIVSQAIVAGAALGPGVAGMPVHVLEIMLGFLVGAMLLWQMRALAAEREARTRAWEQATTAERQRITREVHDLVAHSLSVTLLQITGVRHGLDYVREADGAEEREQSIDDIDAALASAEQVGRKAMTDIRMVMSDLAGGRSERHTLPQASDIAGLVRELQGAGMAIEYLEAGDLTTVPHAEGLGLYRIAQESLANAAKYAGKQVPVHVRLTVNGASTRLTVSNALPATGRARPDGLNLGMAGMEARAAQLGARFNAGQYGGAWVVDVHLRPHSRRAKPPYPLTIEIPRLA